MKKTILIIGILLLSIASKAQYSGTYFKASSYMKSPIYFIGTDTAATKAYVRLINIFRYPDAGIPLSTGSAWGTSIINNSSNWNTAYSWGDWASNFGTTSGKIAQGNDSRINNGQIAYGWGNHTGLYKIIGDSINLNGFATNYKLLNYKLKSDSINLNGFATNYKLLNYKLKSDSLNKSGFATQYDISLIKSSQWITSGNDIYYNTGSIGLGISPTYTVDIKGKNDYTRLLNIEGISTREPNTNYDLYGIYSQPVGSGSESDTVTIYGIYTSPLFQLYDEWSTNKCIGIYSNPHGNNKSYSAILMGGNVGIGTEHPKHTLDVIGTSRFGTVANHTSTEADGTLVFTGDATVYKDAIVQFIYKGGTGEANFDTYINSIKQLKFLVNDIVALSNTEAPHDYNEGTAIELHLHWMVNAPLIAGDKIQWQLDYSIANVKNGTNTNTLFCDPTNPTVFGARSVTVEYTAPVGGIPAGTNLYTTIETISDANMSWVKIGCAFIGTLKRIAKSAGGTDPTTGCVFANNMGIHYQINTIGSRTPTAK